jgi:hypothetical protein
MKDLIKHMLREGLLKENQLEEGKFRSAVAGGLMGLGALAGGKAQAQDVPKPQTAMFGTPEQRAAKKAQRDANVKKIERDYIAGAVNANLYEPIDDTEYQQGMAQVNDIPFFDRKVTYSEMGDGTKIKVFIKKYSKFLANNQNKPDADRTYGAGFCKTGKNGERISEPGDTETNRKHCIGSQVGLDQKKAVETGQNKT